MYSGPTARRTDADIRSRLRLTHVSEDRQIIGITSVSHAAVHTYELSIPILMVAWLAEFDDLSRATLGLVVGGGYVLFGLGSLPGGVLADRIGSRSLIVGCLLGMSAGFVALSLSTGIVGIAVGLLVWGAAASVYHPAGLSLLTRGVERRGRALGYHGVAGNVGIGVGPLATAVLLMFLDWRTVSAILAVPALVAAVYAFRLDFDEPVAADGGETDGEDGGFFTQSRALFASTFAVAFVVVAASGLYYRGILTFLPDILADTVRFEPDVELEFEASSYVYSALLIVGIAGQYAGGRLVERGTERWMTAGYVALAAVALVFVPVLDAPVLLVSVALVFGFFLFVIEPLYQNAVALHTPPEARGVSYGYTYLGFFGVGALGATVAGTVLTYLTEEAVFVVFAGVAVVGAVGAAHLLREDT